MSKPTGRARELGANLRYHRERAEWSEKQAAEFLEISQGQLCRIELGYRSISETNVVRALAMYGVRGDDFAETLALSREINNDRRVLAHNDRLPDELRALIHLESTATHIDSFQPSLIPGLLQTEDYARALFSWAKFPEDGAELRIGARMERQQLLQAAKRPGFRFLIHESALNPPAIEPVVMREQLMALVFAGNLPGTEVRVVPANVGPVGALVTGPFMFLRYAEFTPIVYVENIRTSEFLEDPGDLQAYRFVVNRLASLALSAAESREVLVKMAT